MIVKGLNMVSSDDQFIVSPFYSFFQYIAEVPHAHAIQILDQINKKTTRRDLETRDFNFDTLTNACPDGASLKARSVPLTRGLQNRQTGETLGHHTTGQSIPIRLFCIMKQFTKKIHNRR